MEYVTLGRSGLAVSRLCLGTMTFGREADEAASRAMVDRFLERRRDVHRHRRRLRARRLRGDRRARARRPPRRRRAGDEGPLPDGRRRQRRRPLPAPRDRRLRGIAAAAGHRLDRPLPGAHVGRPDADRGDAVGADRPRAAGQGPLRRRIELRRLAPDARRARRRRARLRALRVPAAAVLADRAPARARDRPRGGGARPRADPVGAAGAGMLTGKYDRSGPGVRTPGWPRPSPTTSRRGSGATASATGGSSRPSATSPRRPAARRHRWR